MKIRFIVGLFLAATLALTGCRTMFTGRAGVVQVKVIDGKTDLPLAGVSGMWREDADNLLTGHYQNGPAALPPSDSAGIITISNAHKKMNGRLILECPGYVTMYGLYSDGVFSFSREIQPPPFSQDTFELDDAQPAPETGDGVFVVKMPQ
jgi:hypothetical protein